MREKSHPRRKLICEARQDGHSQTQHLKEVPRPGDENQVLRPLSNQRDHYLKEVPRPGDENV